MKKLVFPSDLEPQSKLEQLINVWIRLIRANICDLLPQINNPEALRVKLFFDELHEDEVRVQITFVMEHLDNAHYLVRHVICLVNAIYEFYLYKIDRVYGKQTMRMVVNGDNQFSIYIKEEDITDAYYQLSNLNSEPAKEKIMPMAS